MIGRAARNVGRCLGATAKRFSSTYEFRWRVRSPRLRSFVLVSAIQRVSRTDLGLMSVQLPLETAAIVSLRVCHPQPIRRRSDILISEMSFSHSLQSGSR